MQYPELRMRRLRSHSVLRSSLSETNISLRDLILPLFVHDRESSLIQSLAPHRRLSLADLKTEVSRMLQAGVEKFILFGVVYAKDDGNGACNPECILQRAIRLLKAEFGQKIWLVADLCLCEYTSHGHCGILDGTQVHNDQTLELLGRVALSYAEAGVDCIAPSGMMDGTIKHLRNVLKSCPDLSLLGYSAKFASAFYGPFREAAGSSPEFGDRSGYQMNPANAREALREIELDIQEGADMVMVKPALAYLDIILKARQNFDLPVLAYNVSGEYAMIKAAASNGWLDLRRSALESLLSIKRAGADLILSYWALDWVNERWG